MYLIYFRGLIRLSMWTVIVFLCVGLLVLTVPAFLYVVTAIPVIVGIILFIILAVLLFVVMLILSILVGLFALILRVIMFSWPEAGNWIWNSWWNDVVVVSFKDTVSFYTWWFSGWLQDAHQWIFNRYFASIESFVFYELVDPIIETLRFIGPYSLLSITVLLLWPFVYVGFIEIGRRSRHTRRQSALWGFAVAIVILGLTAVLGAYLWGRAEFYPVRQTVKSIDSLRVPATVDVVLLKSDGFELRRSLRNGRTEFSDVRQGDYIAELRRKFRLGGLTVERPVLRFPVTVTSLVQRLEVDSTQVMSGESISLRALMANTGDKDETITLDLRRGASLLESQTVTVPPGFHLKEFRLDNLPVGEHTLKLAGEEITVSVAPRPFLSLEQAQYQADLGSALTVSGTTNFRDGTDIELSIVNGSPVAREVAQVAGGRFTHTFETRDLPEGEFRVKAFEPIESLEATASLKLILRYAAMGIVSFEPVEPTVIVGDTLRFLVTARNSGNAVGNRVLELLVDGQPRSSVDVSVSPGDVRRIEMVLETSEGDEGTHVASVGELTTSFLVRPVPYIALSTVAPIKVGNELVVTGSTSLPGGQIAISVVDQSGNRLATQFANVSDRGFSSVFDSTQLPQGIYAVEVSDLVYGLKDQTSVEIYGKEVPLRYVIDVLPRKVVQPTTEVGIRVRITNAGVVQTAPLNISVNGAPSFSRPLTIESGATVIEQFDLGLLQVGDHEIDVDGLLALVRVESPIVNRPRISTDELVVSLHTNRPEILVGDREVLTATIDSKIYESLDVSLILTVDPGLSIDAIAGFQGGGPQSSMQETVNRGLQRQGTVHIVAEQPGTYRATLEVVYIHDGKQHSESTVLTYVVR